MPRPARARARCSAGRSSSPGAPSLSCSSAAACSGPPSPPLAGFPSSLGGGAGATGVGVSGGGRAGVRRAEAHPPVPDARIAVARGAAAARPARAARKAEALMGAIARKRAGACEGGRRNAREGASRGSGLENPVGGRQIQAGRACSRAGTSGHDAGRRKRPRGQAGMKAAAATRSQGVSALAREWSYSQR